MIKRNINLINELKKYLATDYSDDKKLVDDLNVIFNKIEITTQIIESLLQNYIIIDNTGKIIEISLPALNLLKYSQFEFNKNSIFEIDCEYLNKSFDEFLKKLNEFSFTFQTTFLDNQNQKIAVEVKSCLLKIDNEDTIFLFFKDISEEVKKWNDLLESEERFKNMFYNQHSIMMVIHPESGKIVDVNEAATKFYGYSRETFLKELYFFDINYDIRLNNLKELWISKNKISNYFISKHKNSKNEVKDVEIRSGPIIVRGKTLIFATIYDITERKKIEDEISVLTAAVHNSPVPIFITDYQGFINYVNPAFIKISGYNQSELIGKTLEIVKPDSTPPEDYQQLLDDIYSGKIWGGELLNKKKNGDLYWLRVYIYPIKNQEGQIKHFVVIGEDITEQKKILTDLENAKKLAEKSDRMKTEFISRISKEIRDPANVLISFLDYIEEELTSNISEDLKLALISSKEASKTISKTIDTILNFSELQVGLYNPNFEKINLTSLIEKIIDEFKAIYISKKLDLIFKKTCNDCEVFADKFSLYQIIFNLIDNAIKFTNKGFIKVLLLKDEVNHLQLDIIDTGKGIAPDKIKDIFSPFEVDTDSSFKNKVGLGLGLPIVKKYCEINNIEIYIESILNKGTKVSLIFKN